MANIWGYLSLPYPFHETLEYQCISVSVYLYKYLYSNDAGDEPLPSSVKFYAGCSILWGPKPPAFPDPKQIVPAHLFFIFRRKKESCKWQLLKRDEISSFLLGTKDKRRSDQISLIYFINCFVALIFKKITRRRRRRIMWAVVCQSMTGDTTL